MEKQDSTSSAEDVDRLWASASFFLVLIILGVPLWWETTNVYRATLPYDKINELNTESHYITSELTLLAYDQETADNVARQIMIEFEQYDVIKLQIDVQVISDEFRYTLDKAEGRNKVDVLRSAYDLSKQNMFYVVQSNLLDIDVWVGRQRLALFKDAKSAPTLIRALKDWIYQPTVLAGVLSEVGDSARRLRYPNEAEFHVLLSVVAPDPHLMKVEFNASQVIEDYIGYFVDHINNIHSFTLKSQWLHLVEFNFEARERDGAWWVLPERLQLLVSQLEARAAPHAADRAAINLALYVAPCAVAPLVIYETYDDTRVQAFLTPKWGGVVIANPSKEECKQKIYKPDVRLIMGNFVAQLKQLLGMYEKREIDSAILDCLYSPAPREWEVDALLRIRTLEQVASAEKSLKSLSELLGKISNIVINDEVGAWVSRAAAALECARAAMRGGQLAPAHAAARDAFLAAEAAFADPSLLALLYFPDDQKYAIYIPLFLPILLPVLLSLKKLLAWLRGKPAQQLDRAKIKEQRRKKKEDRKKKAD